MMQSYKYKHNLIDTDLLDYYHIINALHKTTCGQLCKARLWLAYLMQCGPIFGLTGISK